MTGHASHTLGLGLGWRPELAWLIDRHPDLGFIEILAEDFDPGQPPPAWMSRLRQRGMMIIPHGVSLSLGGVEAPDSERVQHLNRLARQVEASLVSEHVAFVRAGGREAGHLLPLPRTPAALDVLTRNVRQVQEALPVPLALENIASLFQWPDAVWEEADFLAQLLDRTGALLVLDLANLHAGAVNHGWDPITYLDRLPLARLAYVHVAGGVLRDGVYHDSHAHAVPAAVLDLLEDLYARVEAPGVMLERDDQFPSAELLLDELAAIASACTRGRQRREALHAAP